MYVMCENISLPETEETKEVFINKQGNDIDPNLPKIHVNGEGITR